MGDANKEKMKAAIYNPYFDTLGGGERFTASFIKVLVDKGYSVDIEWKDKTIVQKIENRFGIALKNTKVARNVKRGDGYDVCYWISDGSIPLLKSRNNILIFQEPFKGINGDTLMNKMKFIRINSSICYSKFVKKIIDAEYRIKSKVIPPAVDVERFKTKKKENVILYVGRFSTLKQSKNQDVLIEVFKKMCDKGLKGWRLILAGGVEVGVGDFVEGLETMSKDYPIEIIQSPSLRSLESLYGKAKIFWSATGFGVDEKENPGKMEHFGITVVEAMSAGAVPLAFNGGGHKEIVKSGHDGYLWVTKKDLTLKTLGLIKDKELLSEMKRKALKSAERFSYEKFEKKVINIL